MKGLLLKEWYTLGNYKKAFLTVLVFTTGFGVFFKASNYMSIMLVILANSCLIGSFSYDESASWDRYAVSLPVNRGAVVNAKYLFTLLCLAAIALFAGLLGVAQGLVHRDLQVLASSLSSLAVVLCASLLSLSVSLPIAFRLGAEKARVTGTVIYVALFAALMLGVYLMGERPDVFLASLAARPGLLAGMGGMLAALLAAGFAASFLLSRRWYAGRDF